ncbi:STAS domain-containing protein [Actinomadura darangshiensis]|nr:STAS domain-containing protein [Actinomadura darangshiensis]
MVAPANSLPNGTTFTRAQRDGWQVVTITGELDVAMAQGVADQLSQAISTRTPPLVAVDLSRMAFCDSAGLREMIIAWKRVRVLDGRYVLLNPAPRFIEILRITGLDTRFEIVTLLPRIPI